MEINYNPEHKAVLDDLLTRMPGVKASKAFGYPAYKIGRRIFIFVSEDGIALKLPAERVTALIEAHEEMHAVYPVEGTVWRGWVSITPADPADYANYIDLFEESVQFVSS